LFVDPRLAAGEPERGERADDEKEDGDPAHGSRIGTRPDGLDFVWLC
jgi:hypothetical protein